MHCLKRIIVSSNYDGSTIRSSITRHWSRITSVVLSQLPIRPRADSKYCTHVRSKYASSLANARLFAIASLMTAIGIIIPLRCSRLESQNYCSRKTNRRAQIMCHFFFFFSVFFLATHRTVRVRWRDKTCKRTAEICSIVVSLVNCVSRKKEKITESEGVCKQGAQRCTRGKVAVRSPSVTCD